MDSPLHLSQHALAIGSHALPSPAIVLMPAYKMHRTRLICL